MYSHRSLILSNHPDVKEGVYLRDIVDRVEGNRVLSINGTWINIKRTKGIELDESWFEFYGLNKEDYLMCKFVHDLFGEYFNRTETILEPEIFRLTGKYF